MNGILPPYMELPTTPRMQNWYHMDTSAPLDVLTGSALALTSGYRWPPTPTLLAFLHHYGCLDGERCDIPRLKGLVITPLALARPPIRGLHSFGFQLNVSAFCGIRGACRGCSALFRWCQEVSWGT